MATEECEEKESVDGLLTLVTQSKSQGNAHFKTREYHDAISFYDEGIQACVDNPGIVNSEEGREVKQMLGAMYNNRAFCYFRLEMYGACVGDAGEAIKHKFWKAYYRRGCGYAALGKWAKAKKDFSKASKKFPKDKNVKEKLKQASEADRLEKFAAAISVEAEGKASATIDLNSFGMPGSDYQGPRFGEGGPDEITSDWVVSLMEFQRNGGKVHGRYVAEILLYAIQQFGEHENVSRYSIDVENNPDCHRITVCGDVHGQYYDFLNIFEINGLPSETNPYLFNGDFVDRGSWSCEVILVMLCWKICLKDHFMMTRGNHESLRMNVMYGFKGEVEHKYNKKIFDLYTELFCALPLAYILGNKVFVCHGGLFKQDGVTIDDLNRLDRFQQIPDEGPFCDILWSDPQPQSGRAPSKRGGGTMFGPDVTENFLNENGLELVIRSHEVQEHGYSVQHDGKLITVFSAPNYVDQMGNKAAVVRLNRNYQPDYITFEAVSHPDVKPMAYANNPMNFMRFM